MAAMPFTNSVTDTPVRFGPICLEHCPAFDEHGRDYIVPARQIREHLVQQIAFLYGAATEIPKVVVRITNRNLRFESRLNSPFEPILVSRIHRHESSRSMLISPLA